MRSRSTTTSSWFAADQPELSWRPNNLIIYFFLIISTHCLCTLIFTCKKKKIKVKMLTLSSPKTKSWEIMLTVKSQKNWVWLHLDQTKVTRCAITSFDSCSIYRFYNNFPPFNTGSIFDNLCFIFPFGAGHHLLPWMLSHSDVADLPS